MATLAGGARALARCDPGFFDTLSHGYWVNGLLSFGLARRWRQRAVSALALGPGMCVLDAMCGSGELWSHLLPRLGATGRVVAADFAPEMLRRACARAHADTAGRVTVVRAVIPETGVGDGGGFDAVVCAFGVKSLAPAEGPAFAAWVEAALRPGGRFALVDLGVPPGRSLRAASRVYLTVVYPLVGALLARRSPAPFRALWRQIGAWNPAGLAACLEGVGLHVRLRWGRDGSVLIEGRKSANQGPR